MTFHEACRLVVAHCRGQYADYAKAYASAGMDLTDPHEVRTQSLYILNNIVGWRGPMAKEVRETLRAIAADID